MNIFEQTETTRTWDYTLGHYQYSFQFCFADKTQYLEFRSGWRKNYCSLSSDIRTLKRITQEAQRTASRSAHELAQRASIPPSEFHEALDTQRDCIAASQLQQALHARREEARKQMAMRNASKVEAQCQYLVRRTTET